MEQDDQEDIDDQEDEQDVIYTEDDSNNNPDAEHLEDTHAGHRNSDNNTRSMPNENINDAANSTHDAQNQDNHTSGGHHMKHSPSDEDFYGGPSTGDHFFRQFFSFEIQQRLVQSAV